MKAGEKGGLSTGGEKERKGQEGEGKVGEGKGFISLASWKHCFWSRVPWFGSMLLKFPEMSLN